MLCAVASVFRGCRGAGTGGCGWFSSYTYHGGVASLLVLSGSITGIDDRSLYGCRICESGVGGYAGCVFRRMSAYIRSWSVSMCLSVYVWSIAACVMYLVVSGCTRMWSSARPLSWLHRVT